MDAKLEPIVIEGNSLAQDFAQIRPFVTATSSPSTPVPPAPSNSPAPPRSAESGDVEDDVEDSGVKGDVKAIAELCELLHQDKESRKGSDYGIYEGITQMHGADIAIHVGESFVFPAHAVILAARSAVLNEVLLGKEVTDGRLSLRRAASVPDSSSLPCAKKGQLVFSSVHPLSTLIFISYLYTDDLPAVWDRRVGLAVEHSLGPLNVTPAKIREELQALARLCNLPALTTALESHVKRDPLKTLSNDMQTLFDNAQMTVPQHKIGAPNDVPLLPDTISTLR